MRRRRCTTGVKSEALELVRIDSPGRIQPVAESIDDSSLLVSTSDRTFDEPWKVWSFTAIDRALQADSDRSRLDVDVAPHIGGLDEPGETTRNPLRLGRAR